jgi:ankyrin repeat protein
MSREHTFSTVTHISDALQRKDWNTVFDQLDNHSDPNLRDDQGNYLIQYAVLYNDTRLVRKLVQLGCKLDVLDKEGHNICYNPIKFGNLEVLQLLTSFDVHQIGVHLQDLQDEYGNVPLHTSIMFNNRVAFDLLLPKSNPNIRDNHENNALHITLSTSKDVYYVNALLKAKTSPYHLNKDGVTPLHLAMDLNDTQIITTMVSHTDKVSVLDVKHKTPLMYAIENQNIDAIKSILSKDTNADQQDVFGNSVLHYAVASENAEIVHLIVAVTKKFNHVNMDGSTALHMLLSMPQHINRFPVKLLLQNTNVNIQNNDGNTVLHLLVQNDSWHEYNDILSRLKLNINIKNEKNKRPLDIVSDKQSFIATVTLSYYNALQQQNKVWYDDWENQCNALKEKVPKTKEECLNIIKYNLDKRSLPFSKSRYCVNINTPKAVKMSTFTGSTLDILSGCLLLHTNTTLTNIPLSSTLISREFVRNPQIEQHYESLGYIKNTRTEFYNFEVMWIYNRLFVPTTIQQTIQTFLNSNQRFLIMPLGIEQSQGAHANILIYDKQLNCLERFEPNGSDPPYGFYYRPLTMDAEIHTFFKGLLDTKLSYIRPNEFLPKIGFQGMEEVDTMKRIGDPDGFCVAWCFWYASQRLRNPDLPPAKLVKKVIFDIRAKNIKFRQLIRDYAEEITKIRNKLLGNVDVNDWINNTVTDKAVQEVIQRISFSISSQK